MLDTNREELTITLRHEPGRSLDRHIDADTKCTLSPSDCHALLHQISCALAFIHSNSIVHDDVKPDNIMFSSVPFPHAVLIDFGAAFNQAVLGKDYFILAGTPLYVPPEFLDKKKGPEGDVWGFGVTMLYAMRKLHLPEIEFFIPNIFSDWETRKEMEDWLDEIEEKVEELQGSGDQELVRKMLVRKVEDRITAAELVMESEREAVV